MTHPRQTLATFLAAALLLSPVSEAFGQTATVTLSSQKQYIRGFGGMVHIPWAGDLTAAERTLAFGNADGQLGFTILRIAVPDGSANNSYVATAKAAIAAGGLVYATPWNGSGSMDSSQFATYADHLSSFVSYMKGQGAELYAISVQNEPDYATQSGWRAWTPAQCHDFVASYGDKVGTKLMSCESFNYTKSYYDPILNDDAALAKLGVLGTHLYGTAVNSYPYPLFDQKAAGKVERWMTEHYTDSTTDANSWPNALGVASELHNAMVKAQFNVYTWWYIKRSYGPINNGAVTKRGWCMAHWSKFVRPGFYRVDATESPASGVSLSAYKSDTDVVIVAVNTGSASQALTISVAGGSISSYDKFTTSSSKSFASDGKITATGGSLSVTLDGSSVTTLHGTGTVPVSDAGAPGTGGAGGAGGTGNGGATGADAGRDALASGGTGGTATAGSGGAGGKTSPDANGSGGATTAGGASGTGGTKASGGGVGTGGASVVGSGGQVGSGGAATTTQASGGAVATGGATSGGSAVAGGSDSQGCSCHLGRPNAGPEALLLGLPFLVWARRRRLRRR